MTAPIWPIGIVLNCISYFGKSIGRKDALRLLQWLGAVLLGVTVLLAINAFLP